MCRWTGLYLHGFLSSELSDKGQWFAAQLNSAKPMGDASSKYASSKSHSQIEIEALKLITYPTAQVEQTVTTIEEQLNQLRQSTSAVFIMGSSMGGFYAQYFGQKYQIPYIMINPALNIDELLSQHQGLHHNQRTSESTLVDEHYVKSIACYRVDSPDYTTPALLLMDEDDEVIDVEFCRKQYAQDKLQHLASTTRIYNGGDHSFIHLDEAWLEINQFLSRL